MISFFFLFSEKISLERFDWILNCLSNFNLHNRRELNSINFFITGEAIYTLVDARYQKYWIQAISRLDVKCYVDSHEMQIIGIKQSDINKALTDKIIFLKIKDKLEFWKVFLEKNRDIKTKLVLGFIQFNGPYMHRNSVYSCNALEAAIYKGMKPELYAYLDGLHVGHRDQKPSAFLNVGQKLITLTENAKVKGLEFLMLGCSRCGKARGYAKVKQDESYYYSGDTIPSFYLCNLNEIVRRFEENHLIISPFFGGIQQDNNKELDYQASPPILIFITHGPYAYEWTFGGLSFAMACANHDIKTRVVFIEDGVYSLAGDQQFLQDEKIFNIQEMLNGISDIEDLYFYAYSPSLKMRNSSISSSIENIKTINAKELSELIRNTMKSTYHTRIMFF